MATPEEKIDKVVKMFVNGMPADGKDQILTYARRIERCLNHERQEGAVEDDAISDAALGLNPDNPYSFPVLKELVMRYPESVTAKGLLKSAFLGVIGNYAIQVGDFRSAASAIAEGIRKHGEVVQFDAQMVPLVMAGMSTLYSDTSQDVRTRAEALFVDAHLLSYQRQFQKCLTQLRLAQWLIPEDPYLRAFEGDILGTMGEKAKALDAYQSASSLGLKDPQRTLFFPAVLLDSIGIESRCEKIISLLDDFVNCAEPDARQVPAAYYRLALAYGSMEDPSQDGVEVAKRFFNLGLKADQARLPVYEDEAKSFREQAEVLLQRYNPCGNTKCSAHAQFRCSECEQEFYCCVECQLACWPSHKVICKNKVSAAQGEETK